MVAREKPVHALVSPWSRTGSFVFARNAGGGMRATEGW